MAAPPREVYLAEGFDGNKLKVPQLRSVLLEHSIYFPSAAKKADLVALFASQVQPRAAQILAADAKVRPSGHGIIAVSENGDEAPVVEPSAGAKRPRGRPKKSTALEVEPEADVEVAEPAPKKPRARKSTVEPEGGPITATPKKPRKSIKKKLEEAALEAEQELAAASATASTSTPAPPVAPTPSRRKSRAAATPKTAPPAPKLELPTPKPVLVPVVEIPSPVPSPVRVPRTSFAVPPSSDDEATPKRKPRMSMSMEEDDGGFSDFNPFQAGSTQAAQAERRRRKSSLGLGEAKRRVPRPSEWTATSVPTDVAATPSILRRVGPNSEHVRLAPEEVRAQWRQEVEDEDEDTKVKIDETEVVQEEVQVAVRVADEKNKVVEQKIIKPKRKAIIRKKPQPAVTASSAFSIGASLLFFLLASYYKSFSSANGFCDAGLAVNDVIVGREDAITQTQSCIKRRAAWHLDHEGKAPFECDMNALPIAPWFPRSTECTPCPQYATCTNGEVDQCAPDYILTPHLLGSLSPFLDGWPGLPSRVFPPHCRPDTQRLRQIGALAKDIESELASRRGDIVCRGDNSGASIGESYGQLETPLRESFAERRVAEITREKFDELFDAALQDLVEHGEVIESIDVDGNAWYAAARTNLTWMCSAKLETLSLADQWKSQLFGTAAMIALIVGGTKYANQSKAEKERAAQLAQVVLKRLQDQEQLHYIDPVTTPQSYLPPAQLRDIVLPASESAATRKSLWDKVEALIEKNANVAVGEREVRGDIWKTWEWTGVGQRAVEYM